MCVCVREREREKEGVYEIIKGRFIEILIDRRAWGIDRLDDSYINK